jgi:response regulator RpfG family c-di-GMP phosphodiesterase
MKYKILIVDDEPANLRVLDRLISREHVAILANSAAEALELLLQHDFAVIISDQRMPGMTGLEFLKKAAELRQQTVRIILTGYTDVETLVEAINSGVVYQYVTKPWVNDDLLQTIKRGLQHHESIKYTHLMKHDISRLNYRLEATRKGLIRLWSEVIKLRSPALLSHAERISRYARTIGDLLSLDPEVIDNLSLAAFLFPSVYGPSTIRDVLSGAPVSETEFGLKTVELESGLAVFSEIDVIEEFAEIEDIIRYANEYFDGNGFPNRLTGERIPISSRVVAVARSYDLLTAAPIDEQCLSHEDAVRHMNELAGSVFDPTVVEVLNRLGFISQVPEVVISRFSLNSEQEPFRLWQFAN